MKIKVKTMTELLKLRDDLSRVSDLSYRYNVLKKTYPIQDIGEDDAQELINTYRGMLSELGGQNEKR